MSDTQLDGELAVMEKPKMSEQWTELRCIACVPLGWESSRLLLRIEGFIPQSEAQIEVKCHRCKSVVSWQIGTLNIGVKSYGQKNHKRATAAFE